MNQAISEATPLTLSTHRQLELLRDLQRLANKREQSEQRIAKVYRAAVDDAERVGKQQLATIERDFELKSSAAQRHHDEAMAEQELRYTTTRNATQETYRIERDKTEAEAARAIEAAIKQRKQSQWQTLAVFDASKGTPKLRLEESLQKLAEFEHELAELAEEQRQILAMRNFASIEPNATEATGPANEVDVPTAVDGVRAAVTALYEDRATQWLEGARPWSLGFVLLVLPVVPFGLLLGWGNWIAYAAGLVLGAVIAAVTVWLLAAKARNATAIRLADIATANALVQGSLVSARAQAHEISRQEAASLIANRDREIAEAQRLAEQNLVENEAWKSATLAVVNEKYPATLAAMRIEHQQTALNIENELRDRQAVLTRERDEQSKAATALKQNRLRDATAERDQAWQQMYDDWHAGFGAIENEIAAMNAACDRLAPNWMTTKFADWEKPNVVTLAIPFGKATLSLAKVKAALSSDTRLLPSVSELELPTLLHLVEQPTLVVTAPGNQRSRAGGLLQWMMVRFLTAMPPGKVRLTLCDPVGLGESFSAFMHLADYDETLIASRIWTQQRDIDEQLLRLTTHMETILQKYLRDEYDSIHEYNAQAGEVAEPFQVLAIADFPHALSDTALKRLTSLVKGGPRCGIYVMLSVDLAQKIAGEVKLETLLENAVHLDWNNPAGRFVWKYPAFEYLPLALPEPLPADRLVPLLKQIGQAAQNAIKVEVPFEVVAPDGELWRQTCDSELRVPIGRAGANRLQYVRLGKGTSQHLLVAGKTGSGKSTFLHALVTSAALHFSPNEVEFYLVDFKKGVEFKSYATQRLPHARVIAIESEREFGISVLERLDEVLRERGEKFRASGVQSLADFRAAHPDEPMPRVLLVVDEFQELFVEDDKLAGQASLLLDRLIRQGRAFGMHVILGSQTLAGAYSLARATLGQMAVRVALQCSETDAHLILSDERNQAARFLSRPGEAIYNDQNGMATANEPFQVVWLADAERSGYLGQVRDRTVDQGLSPEPPIVFEGNAPSDPRENRLLAKQLAGERPLAPRAWLGAAVSIRPPVQVEFHRSAGSNLLVVGQNESLALGVLATATVGLATSGEVGVDIVDGSRTGEPGETIWPAVAEALGENVRHYTSRNATTAVAELANELARREREGDESAPQRLLLVFNAARIRELRKSDDDFGFSFTKEDKGPSTSKQFVELVKNGPTWGIHVIVWCDNYNALSRIVERAMLRDFDHRVVMQMAAGDSSNLIDTPAAARLSEFRALLYSDETGDCEKFRPYEIPSLEWLASLGDAERVG